MFNVKDIVQQLRAVPETGANPDLIEQAADALEYVYKENQILLDYLKTMRRITKEWLYDWLSSCPLSTKKQELATSSIKNLMLYDGIF